ncbi:MAG: FGGY family carbohydrate kinase, partial [Spirochaetes bacterium]|nr:FGGY family carbohydrate kinase [Spirochaetota bacterium]
MARAGTKIIAYDLGTGGSKASIFDADGTCLASTFIPYDTLYPDTGWHEQRPNDWWNAIVASTRALLASGTVAASDIACLAISGQSLGVVPIDAEGALLREATPIWSDTRASRQTAAFFSKV